MHACASGAAQVLAWNTPWMTAASSVARDATSSGSRRGHLAGKSYAQMSTSASLSCACRQAGVDKGHRTRVSCGHLSATADPFSQLAGWLCTRHWLVDRTYTPDQPRPQLVHPTRTSGGVLSMRPGSSAFSCSFSLSGSGCVPP